MSDFCKLILKALYSENSDYSDPAVDLGALKLALTPAVYLHQVIPVGTTAETLDLSAFTTITAMVLYNKSATAAEVVDATWFHQKGSRAAGNLAAVDGNPDTFTSAANDFLTSGASTGGWVRVASAEDTANDGTYLIQLAAAGTITLYSTAALTANLDDDTAVLYFERKNIQGIPAGGLLVVTDNVVPAGDLVLLSESGTPELEILVIGS